MKTKKLLFLIPALVLVACNKPASTSSENQSSSSNMTQENKISLDDLSNLLLNKFYDQEIDNSNKVVFEEINKRGESRLYNTNETLTIFSDETSLAVGEEKYEFLKGDGKEKGLQTDAYKTLTTTKMYDNQKVFYKVTDFEDGTLNAIWNDAAYRLPVYASGNASENGVTYLLEDSVPGQIAKQVSLISRNFVASYFTGNPDLMLALPSADISHEDDKTIYSIKDFTYSYGDDDGSNTEVLIEFEFVTNEENGLLESTMVYQTTTGRSGEEPYVENLTSHYTISYGERVSSSSVDNLINPEDYFLQEVEEVRAYVYSNGYKEYVDLNNLPLGAYVHFEASEYVPSKSVDLEMYPVSSNDEKVVQVSGNVFETLKSGECRIVVESATGVSKEVSVRVNIPTVKSISYFDTYSGIETHLSGDTTTRYIYTDTKYSNINVSPRPSNALVEDIEIIVSDESVLEVTVDEEASNANLLSLKYNVLKNNDANEVTVTFRSKVDTSIEYSVTYKIKNRLSEEEMLNKLTSNTYKWTNLYDAGVYGLLTFTNDHEGSISYYRGSELIGDAAYTFTYSLVMSETGIDFSIKMNTYYGFYKYDDATITLDGEEIVLSVNVTDYMHHYEVVK